MLKYYIFLKTFLICFIFCHILCGLSIYIIDPLQYFRPIGKYGEYITSVRLPSRAKVTGAVKFEDYDSIIVGTCLVQNFSYSAMYTLLKKKVLNLGSPSLTLLEQNHVVNFALRSNKKIDTIYWSLESALYNAPEEFNDLEGKFPHYLYNKNHIIDLFKNYLFNPLYFCKSLKILYFYIKQHSKKYENKYYLENSYYIENFNKWPNLASVYSKSPCKIDDEDKKLIIENSSYLRETVQKLTKNISDAHTKVNIAVWQQKYKKYVISVIEQHPDIEFKFFFAPYSTLTDCKTLISNYEHFTKIILMKIWIIKELSKFPNVTIFDFSISKEIVFNLNNYTPKFDDYIHYYPRVNDYMVEAMQKNKFIVDNTNIKQTIINQLDLILAYAEIFSKNK